ncbi:hypothetical protein, unlikely [Trypanosoma brucei gambiense DAL972]|uniref:Uncharacterized protein n=1 Tax=Trypanosoma brucei gambiense (strain MHOM/CI/86/DAL972) TaxID=679716 RepID=C9ZMQ8_TRYB9|nr:hypothetical protein, unlikely [Trypanosoma brucei gambiense DAL972]CBH10561.1 hypothetical protein, unlikely [Trypanosoma brucei gambiense DAL972]|eukprot:XP_011772850.1 hypothetical protein, unlikely [Trypanosoma brucei gambiense DAL972]
MGALKRQAAVTASMIIIYYYYLHHHHHHRNYSHQFSLRNCTTSNNTHTHIYIYIYLYIYIHLYKYISIGVTLCIPEIFLSLTFNLCRDYSFSLPSIRLSILFQNIFLFSLKKKNHLPFNCLR